MRTLAAVGGALALTCVVAAGIPFGPAQAQAPDEQGWWTATTPSLPAVGVTAPAAPPAPPDVPAEGLLVEGGPAATSPLAYAAVLYELSSGETATTLTLDVAPQSATTPNATLEICPLTHASFQSEQGGPMSDAPAYSCAKNVTAQPSASGNSYKFAVSRIAQGGSLAIAVLPTSPTDRVVLSEPDSSSLTVQGGSEATNGNGTSLVPASIPSGTVPAGPAPAGAPVGEFPPSTPGSVGAPAPGSSAEAPVMSAPARPPVLAPASPARSQPSGSQTQTPLPAAYLGPASGPAKPLAVAVVILVALAGAAAWSGSGRAAIRASANRIDPWSSEL